MHIPGAQRTLVETLENPDLTLARAVATYILYKRRRLTEASERSYTAILNEFTKHHPGARLHDFEPPRGTIAVEEFLTARWGHLAERTYNRSLAVLSDFFQWHVVRGTLLRDPVAGLERAKARPVYRITFTRAQIDQIFATNPEPRDQIALRLLLHYAIRKGALRGVQLQHFDRDKRRLVIFTKGEKIHTLPIVEDVVWDLLEQLDEPPHHYLLPKTVTRKRTPPTRRQLDRLAAALTDARNALDAATADAQIHREAAALLDTLGIADRQFALAHAAASVRATPALDQPMGEHGTHLWWYRCLTRAGVVPAGTTRGRKLHSARHTAIQAVLERTGNLKAAQAVAGHANVATTGDVYTGWEVEQTAVTLRQTILP